MVLSGVTELSSVSVPGQSRKQRRRLSGAILAILQIESLGTTGSL
jgi:hypothetical protein